MWHRFKVEEMPSGKLWHFRKGARRGWITCCSEMWLHLSLTPVLAGIVPAPWHTAPSLILPSSRTSRGEHFPPAVHWPEIGLLPPGGIKPHLVCLVTRAVCREQKAPVPPLPGSFTPDSLSPGVPLISHYFLSSTELYYHLNSLSAWDVLWGFCLCCLMPCAINSRKSTSSQENGELNWAGLETGLNHTNPSMAL